LRGDLIIVNTNLKVLLVNLIPFIAHGLTGKKIAGEYDLAQWPLHDIHGTDVDEGDGRMCVGVRLGKPRTNSPKHRCY
jgi:hypothetical protein